VEKTKSLSKQTHSVCNATLMMLGLLPGSCPLPISSAKNTERGPTYIFIDLFFSLKGSPEPIKRRCLRHSLPVFIFPCQVFRQLSSFFKFEGTSKNRVALRGLQHKGGHDPSNFEDLCLVNVSVKCFSKLCFGTIKIQPELKYLKTILEDFTS